MREIRRTRAPLLLALLGIVIAGLVMAACGEEEPAAVTSTAGSVAGAADLSGLEFEVHQEPG